MHAGRVVPGEEWFVCLLRVITIEEVDHLCGDLLIDGLRALQRQRSLILTALVLRRAVGGFTPKDITRRGQADRGLWVHRWGIGEARNRCVLARRRDPLLGRGLVD